MGYLRIGDQVRVTKLSTTTKLISIGKPNNSDCTYSPNLPSTASVTTTIAPTNAGIRNTESASGLRCSTATREPYILSPCPLKVLKSARHMALILGRPRTIHVDDCTLMPPIDCDISADLSLNPTAAASNRHIPSSYSPVIFQYSMAHKIHDMFSLGATRPHIQDYSVVTWLHREVIELINKLPPAFRLEDPDTSWDSRLPNLPKQREYMACIAWSYLMSLHRPHVEEHLESRDIAIKCALNTLEAQQKLIDLIQEHHHIVYGFSFYSIDAGIFLSAVILNFPPEDQDMLGRIDAALRQAIARLERMKDRSVLAASGADILRKYYQKSESVLAGRSQNFSSSSGPCSIVDNFVHDEGTPFTWPVVSDSSYYANSMSEVLDAGLTNTGSLAVSFESLPPSQHGSTVQSDPSSESASLEPSYSGDLQFY